MFHKGKYSKPDEKKPVLPLLLILVAVIAVLIVVLIFVAGNGSHPVDKPQTSTNGMTDSIGGGDTVPTTEPVGTLPGTDVSLDQPVTIDTSVCTLEFPGEFSRYLSHTEAKNDDAVIEFFYMVKDELRLELFQIIFSTESAENDIGMLKTDDGNLYISVAASNLDDQELSDQQTIDLYHGMMAAVDVVLDSIRADSRFSKKGEVDINIVDTKLDYWDVALPENMSWEEVNQDGSYLVTFYGTVNGEKYKLYAAAIGEPRLSSVLGAYELDSQKLAVSVESYDLPDTDGWNDAAVTELYTMMSTINNLIQAIMSDGAFSTEIDQG